jgi:hypothetical protein
LAFTALAASFLWNELMRFALRSKRKHAATMAAGLLVLFMARPTLGQPAPQPTDDAGRREVVPFLDSTYVFITVPRDDLNFEADIQPNLVIYQNFTSQLAYEGLTGAFHEAWSIVGTPRVRLREFGSRSAPVRTPSYMPKGSLTALFFRGEPNDSRGARVGIWAVQATLGHHSNGQDGCLFTTDQLVGDDCVGAADLSNINKVDGSFSTNYVRVGGRYRREWLTDISTPEEVQQGLHEQVGTDEFTIAADVEQHFHTDPRVAPYYGRTRATVSIAAATHLRQVCRSRLAGSATLYYVGQAPSTVGPFALQLEASCTFSDRGGWGAFARYYSGQDYYNLGFSDSISRVVVGVHFEQDGFLRFASRVIKDAEEQRKRQREQR